MVKGTGLGGEGMSTMKSVSIPFELNFHSILNNLFGDQ
jgi:hypothetical protein